MGYRELMASVVLQACEDYKKKPNQRPAIESWIRRGNIFTETMLPDMSSEEIIKAVQRYGEKKVK